MIHGTSISSGAGCLSAQRAAGLFLVLIALAVSIADAAGQPFGPACSEILLLVVLVTIALAISKTAGGISSLIGLFFIGTTLWVAPRPLIALFTGDQEVFTLLFGQMAAPRGAELSHLLAFWDAGVAGLFGGYFLFFRPIRPNWRPLSNAAGLFLRRSFIWVWVIVAVLLPILAHKRAAQFAEGGYLALYLNQADSSFSILPILGYLIPALYAFAVIIGDKKYSRAMIAAVLGYVLCGIFFGRRMELGTWILVALWHATTIKGKTIRAGRLIAGFALTAYGFQWVETLRSQSDLANQMLLFFFSSQGVIFMIPALSFELPSPPLHTVLGSLLSMRHFYRLLGIGSVGTANLLDYISSQSAPDLFAGGNGLSSTGYLDVFYLCGRFMIPYAVVCVFIGFLLHRWESAAMRNRIALFFLCVSLPLLFFVQRSSIFTVTSQVVYLAVFMAGLWVLNLLVNLFKFTQTPNEVFGLGGASLSA